MRAPANLPASPPLAGALALALGRGASGFHRLVTGATGTQAERLARAHGGDAVRLVYRVRLAPWLACCDNPLDVLYPYRLVCRAAPAGALAVVDDAASLFEAAHGSWRRDPLAARIVRRVLLGARVPTFWCAPADAELGPELAVHAPVIALAPADAPPDSDPLDDDSFISEPGLMVLARTAE